MEGRRVNHSAPKRNPLYVMFLCLVAAVFVLLIVVIVLGAKLGAAQKAAKGAETQIEELQEQVKKLEEEKKAAEDAANGPDEKLPGGELFLRLLVFGLTGAVRDKLLDRSGQPCQRLHIAGDDELGGLAVGHLLQRFEALEGEDLLGRGGLV